jgi:hypothetical protein
LVEELRKFEKQIENAIFESRILRNHFGIEILGPQSWRQGYRVLYKNISEQVLRYVGLTSRRKKVQRNLSVYDAKGVGLAIVPSCKVEKALCRICDYYILRAFEAADEEESAIAELINDAINFSSIFCHDDGKGHTRNSIQDVHQRIKRIVSDLEKRKLVDKEPYFYVNRILTLVGIYEDFYIPIVRLETPVEQKDCFFLRYSVENLSNKSLVKRSFLLVGFQTLYFPLEVEGSASNHIRILSPQGTLFRHAGVTGLEGTELERKYGNLDRFLDDNMIYFHVPPEDAGEISELHRKSADERADSTENSASVQENTIKSERRGSPKERKGPTVEVNLGISRNFPWRLSLIRILTTLMYLAVFIPSIVISLGYNVDVFLLVQAMVLVLTILISLAVYAIDRIFLHEYIAAHVIILLALFVAQIVFLHIFF